MRRVENLIEELQDVDRNMHNDPLEIDNIVVIILQICFPLLGT